LEAEQRRREEIDVLRAIATNLPDALYCVDPDSGEYTYVNPAFERITGYTLDEIRAIGGRASFLSQVQEAPQEKRPVPLTSEIPPESIDEGEALFLRRKDGSCACLEDRTWVAPLGSGMQCRWGILRDVTARKCHTVSIENRNALLRTVIDRTTAHIHILDPHMHRFIDANQTALQSLGYSRAEFLSLSLSDIDSSANEALVQKLDRRIAKEGHALHLGAYRKKDGSTFPVEVTLSPAHLERDYIIAIARDISARTQDEAALKESEERFRLISENVADLIAILDHDGKCLYASPSHGHEGIRPEDIVGRSYLANIAPEDVPHLKQRMDRVISGSRHQLAQFRFRHGDGSWRHKETTISLLVDDRGTRLLSVARDITDRVVLDEERLLLEKQLSDQNNALKKTIGEVHQMQQSLIQSEKMASIGQLTAGIAHEINNPLAFVSSNLNRFKEYFDAVVRVLHSWNEAKPAMQKDPRLQQVLATISQAEEQADLEFVVTDFDVLMTHTEGGAERIRSIVDRLRGFSHMADTSQGAIDLNAAMDETLELIWNELKYKATIVKEYGALPRVTCNSGEIKQVLVNLLVNAAQALPAKGTIRLTSSVVDNHAVIEVQDSGVGIPEEHLKRIFDPFFTTKPVGKGTGLGLWISTTIIQKHSGTLTVKSEVGKGTTMTISLPLDKGVFAEDVKAA
jgi:two-component system, NtrC family, sensor kinase